MPTRNSRNPQTPPRQPLDWKILLLRAIQICAIVYAVYVWFIQAPKPAGYNGFYPSATSGLGVILTSLLPDIRRWFAGLMSAMSQNTAITRQANHQLTHVTASTDSSEREIHTLRAELRETKRELEELRREFEVLKTDYRGVHRENADLRESNNALLLENGDFRKRMGVLQGQVTRLKNQVTRLEKELAKHDISLSDME